jgi:Peptidase M76 family
MSTPPSAPSSADASTNKDSSSPAASVASPPAPAAPAPFVPQPVHASEEEADRLCNKWVESGLTQNPAIQFLIRRLEEMGCAPPENAFVQCLQCEVPGAGFFGRVVEERLPSKAKTFMNRITSASSKHATGATATDSSSSPCASTVTTLSEMLQREASGESKLSIVPEIYICQQYMRNELHVHKTMVHELVHAVDQCRTKLDPLHNCLHVACTEVRAENLSGECAFWTELPRMLHGDGKFAGHGKECVRRRAVLSVRGNPNCSANAEKYVDAVLDRCVADVYPFDRHPNQR